MKLKELLNLISDEDVRIELEVDIEEKDDYLYTAFWLSDFRGGVESCTSYKDWIVEAVSFYSRIVGNAEISIRIKEDEYDTKRMEN